VPEEVFAYVDRKGREFDVVTAAALRFDGGALGTIAVESDAHWIEEGIYLGGSRASLTTSIYGTRLQFVTGWSERDTPVLGAADSAEATFVRCLRGQAENLTPARLGLTLAHVIEAILRSAAEHAPVRVPSA
jgi:predicted dehydrogenase